MGSYGCDVRWVLTVLYLIFFWWISRLLILIIQIINKRKLASFSGKCLIMLENKIIFNVICFIFNHKNKVAVRICIINLIEHKIWFYIFLIVPSISNIISKMFGSKQRHKFKHTCLICREHLILTLFRLKWLKINREFFLVISPKFPHWIWKPGVPSIVVQQKLNKFIRNMIRIIADIITQYVNAEYIEQEQFS